MAAGEDFTAFGAMATDVFCSVGVAEDDNDDEIEEKPEPIGKHEPLGAHGTCKACPVELARLKCASCCVVGVMDPDTCDMATALAAATEPKCEY